MYWWTATLALRSKVPGLAPYLSLLACRASLIGQGVLLAFLEELCVNRLVLCSVASLCMHLLNVVVCLQHCQHRAPYHNHTPASWLCAGPQDDTVHILHACHMPCQPPLSASEEDCPVRLLGKRDSVARSACCSSYAASWLQRMWTCCAPSSWRKPYAYLFACAATHNQATHSNDCLPAASFVAVLLLLMPFTAATKLQGPGYALFHHEVRWDALTQAIVAYHIKRRSALKRVWCLAGCVRVWFLGIILFRVGAYHAHYCFHRVRCLWTHDWQYPSSRAVVMPSQRAECVCH